MEHELGKIECGTCGKTFTSETAWDSHRFMEAILSAVRSTHGDEYTDEVFIPWATRVAFERGKLKEIGPAYTASFIAQREDIPEKPEYAEETAVEMISAAASTLLKAREMGRWDTYLGKAPDEHLEPYFHALLFVIGKRVFEHSPDEWSDKDEIWTEEYLETVAVEDWWADEDVEITISEVCEEVPRFAAWMDENPDPEQVTDALYGLKIQYEKRYTDKGGAELTESELSTRVSTAIDRFGPPSDEQLIP